MKGLSHLYRSEYRIYQELKNVLAEEFGKERGEFLIKKAVQNILTKDKEMANRLAKSLKGGSTLGIPNS